MYLQGREEKEVHLPTCCSAVLFCEVGYGFHYLILSSYQYVFTQCCVYHCVRPVILSFKVELGIHLDGRLLTAFSSLPSWPLSIIVTGNKASQRRSHLWVRFGATDICAVSPFKENNKMSFSSWLYDNPTNHIIQIKCYTFTWRKLIYFLLSCLLGAK